MQASFLVSKLIAKDLKPHSEGECVKESLAATVELLALDKAKTIHCAP